jgi:hypothetical protein
MQPKVYMSDYNNNTPKLLLLFIFKENMTYQNVDKTHCAYFLQKSCIIETNGIFEF